VTRFASLTLGSLILDRVFALLFTISMSAAFGASASVDIYLFAVAGPIVVTTLAGDLIYSVLLPEVTRPAVEVRTTDARWNAVAWTVVILVGLSVAYAGVWVIGVLVAQGDASQLLFMGLLASPLVFLGGLSALGATILVAERAYLLAMVRIPLASLVTLVSFALWRQLIPGVEALVASVLSGAFVSALLVSVLAMRRLGLRRFRLRPANAGGFAQRLMRTSLAQLAAGILAQAPIPLERAIGISAGVGITSALNYGRVLVSPPLLLGQSIATASYPRFVGQSSAGDLQRHRELGSTIGVVTFHVLPLSLLLVIFASPLVRVLYQRGTFDELAVSRTAIAASVLAVGLLPIAICAVTTRFLYAEHASGRVALFSAVMLLTYCALALSLGRAFDSWGLAVASTASYVFLMAGLLVAVRDERYRGWEHIPARSFGQSCAAALVMALVIVLIETGRPRQALMGADLGMLVTAVAGVVAYCTAALLLRSAELHQTWSAVVNAIRWARVP
jgi:putative peptidoglycan lipid II flippase